MNAQSIRHGYGHDGHHGARNQLEGSFAYHVRRYRQQYGASGISQKALAMMAHVSRHFIEDLETSPKLQSSVEPLLRVALALEQPVANLVAPELYRSLQEDVERRRRALGGTAAPEVPASVEAQPPRLVKTLFASPTFPGSAESRGHLTQAAFCQNWCH